MRHAGHRQIMSGMNAPTDPQHRPAALDEFELVATGMTALVAKRILEATDDAMSATNASVDATRRANGKWMARQVDPPQSSSGASPVDLEGWEPGIRTMTDEERRDAMAVATTTYASDALADGTVDAVVIGGGSAGPHG